MAVAVANIHLFTRDWPWRRSLYMRIHMEMQYRMVKAPKSKDSRNNAMSCRCGIVKQGLSV